MNEQRCMSPEAMPKLRPSVKCATRFYTLVLGERFENPLTGTWSRKVLVNGKEYRVGIERGKRVRIAFKPRNNGGWGFHYYGFVREDGREVWSDRVGGTLGAKGLLEDAGIIPLPTGDRRKPLCVLDFPYGSEKWCRDVA